ncbi:pyridoxamine 5'-phosphate oxidase family protein [Cupriavidus necator]|uniref:pyridoxamine 5'-phosphate oxidase family protein n=1 Tax=Cupriavidus necator TaxID=106590 RepID=UPI0039C4A48E
MSDYKPTENTRVLRRPERAHYDRELVHSIIDEALVCHVGFVADGTPRVIPTTILRVDENVYLHGSPQNRMLTTLAEGAPACISITHVDGIVAGRSGFGCSVDYRSVVIFGKGEIVDDPEEKAKLLYAVIDSVLPGHKVRQHKDSEIGATLVLRFPLNEVSAKVRDIGVKDVESDYDLDAWAGVIPLRIVSGEVQDDVRLKPGITTPEYARNYLGPSRKQY